MNEELTLAQTQAQVTKELLRGLAARMSALSSDYRHICELRDADVRSKCAEAIDLALVMVANTLYRIGDRVWLEAAEAHRGATR